LISERFSLWLQTPNKDAEESDLAVIFGEWSQNEKLFEIKLPLVYIHPQTRVSSLEDSSLWLYRSEL
jgi:hypothetical protein